MGITATTLAAGVAASVENTQFQPEAEVLARKIVIIGTQLSTKSLTEEELLITSPADAGDKAGFGSMIHRLALKAELGSQGIPTYLLPQDEAGGAAASAGEIDFAGSTGVLAGTLAIYISGDRIPVAITAAMTVEEIADIVVATINADNDTPVVAAKTAVTFEVTLTSKSLGPWGDDIDISLSIRSGDVTPTGVTAAITAMTGGSGVPTISTALNAMGTGDGANESHFTALIHGYGDDSTTLDAILAYVGAGNDKVGLYANTVARPFRTLWGDTVAGSAGLTALQVITDARLQDRAQAPFSVPGSRSHPAEIAAQAVGHAERVNNINGAESYVDIVMIGVDPGVKADRWTNDSDDRDLAVKAGISTSMVKAGNVVIQNLITMYRPANVPVNNNGYRSWPNISRSQNILNSEKVFFSQAIHQNLVIVTDVAKVTNTVARLKARDVNGQLDFVIQLVNAWAGIGWIADAAFTINKLKEGGYVTIREANNGFDMTIPVIYSGNGDILNVNTLFDISFAVFNN